MNPYLRYSKRLPTVPGWYWCRDHQGAEILWFEELEGMGIQPRESRWTTRGWLEHGEVAGPIPEPLEFSDPVCLVHGLPKSQHHCLYCCLCFKPLTVDECHVRKDGKKEDVCNECAEQEAERIREKLLDAFKVDLDARLAVMSDEDIAREFEELRCKTKPETK